MTIEQRLATYGSLAPGRVNHDQLAGLEGTWRKGTVRGTLVESGWGAALGFPGLLLDEGGAAVDVLLFESLDLPDHWERLDAFEGAGYRRERAKISTPDGQLEAFIYVLAP
ncbi:gamma-glutamylcyclotransferase [Rhizobium mongolense]|uniref:gamma-glutamylcyclotransferase family protein n=1 Tax=Rhizobium mongolense TaxID=57676 RepID=UPI0035572E13